jgi:hypothetical protein
MAKKEITTLQKPEIALNVQAITTNTTTVGNEIDTASFGGGINFIVFTGARTDGILTPVITECDTSGGSFTAVADEYLVKQDPSSSVVPETQAVLSAANSVAKIGYIGQKRYVKLSFVSTSITSGLTAGALVEKVGNIAPVAV